MGIQSQKIKKEKAKQGNILEICLTCLTGWELFNHWNWPL